MLVDNPGKCFLSKPNNFEDLWWFVVEAINIRVNAFVRFKLLSNGLMIMYQENIADWLVYTRA